jgi:hypothetical protein
MHIEKKLIFHFLLFGATQGGLPKYSPSDCHFITVFCKVNNDFVVCDDRH